MDRITHTAALARQAAAILPAPPSADDREGAAGWAGLVVTTAERLGAHAGVPPLGLREADVPRRALTGPDLLALAGLPTLSDPAGRRPHGAARTRRPAAHVALVHHRCPGITRVV